MEYTTQSILSLISHVHAVSADFTNKRLAAKGDLVSSHGYILFLLSQKGKLTMSEISELINRDKSTTTVLVRKLKETELVKAENSKEDGRTTLISLTAKGKRYNELTASISKKLLDTCYKGFSKDEKETLLKLLAKVNDNLEKASEE